MAKYYTPQIRFANRDRAALKRMEQSVEKTIQTTSDHVTKKEHFSGVIRYQRDFRRYLTSNLFPPSISYANPSIISTKLPTYVEITGSNFSPGMSLFLNGIAVATMTFIDENHFSFVSTQDTNAQEGPITLFLERSDSFKTYNTSSLRYEDQPDIISYAPLTGFMDGGDLLHITGTSFKQGSSVSFGFAIEGPVTSSNVTWLGNTFIDAFSPAVPSASVSSTNFETGLSIPFRVISPSGLGTDFELFYYKFRAPTATALILNTGSTEGGDTIVVTGSWFNPGATIVMGETTGITTTFISNTELNFLSVPHSSSNVDVVVVNPDLSSSAPLSFSYVGTALPRIYSVVSSFVTPFGTNIVTSGTEVYMSGNNFTSSLDPLVLATDVSVDAVSTNFTIIDKQHITFITPELTSSLYSVQVSGAYGIGYLPNSLRYVSAPTITNFSPTSGSVLGGNLVYLTGTNFLAAPEMTVTVAGLSASWQFIDSEHIVVTIPENSVTHGHFVVNCMELVSGTNEGNYYWVNADALSGPWHPNPIG